MRDSYVIDSKLFGLECFIKYQFHQMRKEYENDMGGEQNEEILNVSCNHIKRNSV